MPDAATFDPAAFQQVLRTAAIGRFLVYRPSVETTMTLARREAAEGAPHGALVLADEQTAGRGRRGRTFLSPPGENLYFTLVLRCPPPVHRLLPVAVPLAVCRAITAGGVDAAIKWPNDIWAGGRKLCGMLIDAEAGSEGLLAFPGIGIDVNGDPTLLPGLRGIATSLRRELGRPVSREQLLAGVCNELEAALAAPFASLVDAYRRLSLVLGRPVLVTAGDTTYEAVAEDIAEDGSLVVRHPGGHTSTITAADVSLRPAGTG